MLYECTALSKKRDNLASCFGLSYPDIPDSWRPGPTIRKIWRVQRDGSWDVASEIEVYGLDAAISIGYRVSGGKAHPVSYLCAPDTA